MLVVVSAYLLKKGGRVKVYYDSVADAVHLELSKEKPDGVVGIEIVNASQRISLNSLLSYEFDPELVRIPTGT